MVFEILRSEQTGMQLLAPARLVMLAALVSTARSSLRQAFASAGGPVPLNRASGHTLRRDAVRARAAPRFETRRPMELRGLSMQSEAQEKPFVCTTPLYYANGPPHMGSAYPTIASDVITQYRRMKGESVVFITGSDEHGTYLLRGPIPRALRCFLAVC